MVVREKCYPRGGTIQKHTETYADGKKDRKIIFGAVQYKSQKKSKPKHSKNLLQTLNKEEEIEAFSAELLNYSTIQDGMNIMGVVKEVKQLYLSVSLPGRMTARVNALDISDSYTKMTQEFVGNHDRTETYKSLSDLYQIGQIVYGRVLDIKQNAHGSFIISMSLKPSEVHGDLVHTNVMKGFIFNGAIEEVQEHGYIIESGIKGLRAFLPLEKSTSGHTVGQLIYLKVKKVTHHKAANICSCEEVDCGQLKIKNQLEPNLDYILPTNIVKFQVQKQLKDGLQGKIMNDAFTAYINEHQLSEPLALPEDYEVGSILNARVLYVMPLTKMVYLTLNLQSTPTTCDGTHPQFKRGDIIDDARVHHHGTGGVILVLNNKFKGVISYKTIKASYKGNYDQDGLLAKYAKKTQHKVRVLGYDIMDSMYICSDDASIVKEPIFALDDLHANDLVTAVVKDHNPRIGGYTLQVGKIKGQIEKTFLAPSTKTLEENSKVRCRVIAVDTQRKIVYLTNRPEYMSKHCKVLTSLAEAKKNSIFTGTVVKRLETYVLVKFFNHLKGILYTQQLNGFTTFELSSFYEGQTLEFRITGRNGDQILLGLVEQMFDMGQIRPVTVINTLDSVLEVNIHNGVENEDEMATDVKGLISIRLLSDFTDLLYAKKHMYPVDAKLKAVCLVNNIFSIRDVKYFRENPIKKWHMVKVGDILRAHVKSVTKDIVELMVPISDYGKLVKVHLNMLAMEAESSNITLEAEQVVYVKLTYLDKATKTITVSAKLIDVWDCEMSSTAEYMKSYLKEVKKIKAFFKNQNHPIAKYSVGDKIIANFQAVHADTHDWLYNIPDSDIVAVVRPAIYGKQKPPSVGTKQECVILWIDYSNSLVFVSNRKSDIDHISSASKLKQKVGSSGINARVLLKHENVFICSLKKGQNPLVYCPIRVHYNDFENSASVGVTEGDFCRLTLIDDTLPIAVLHDTCKIWKDICQKRHAQEKLEALVSQKQLKKNKKEIVIFTKHENSDLKEINTVVTKQANLKRKKPNTVVNTLTSGNAVKTITNDEIDKTKNHKPDSLLFFKDISKSHNKHDIEPVAKKPKVSTPSLPGISDFWNANLTELNQLNGKVESSDEDDEANQDNTAQKKKKLTAAEKFKQQREEEARLRAIEEKYADPNQRPETVDQFDRLVLSEPNNSKHWITYMVFHLQSTEIDKARAVARRAIKAISFRESNEQLNMWVALLNLELRYGTKETYENTVKESLTYNDPLKIYLRVVEILKDAHRTQELIDMIDIITKKFKTQPEVWRAAANAYFAIGKTDRAQAMLNKALSSLPEREHIDTIVMFANLNHKYGENEMAQTLLDQIVTSYPKRIDVWTQYVDMLVKANLIDSARSLLDRAIVQKIPLKKMRIVFKKYLELEQHYGTAIDVEKVKQLAINYVKNNSKL